MIYDDEVTKRDWYMYRRGEMREYLRNHPIYDETIKHALYRWVDIGNSVHDNPWGIPTLDRTRSADFLEAYAIRYKLHETNAE